MKLTSRSMAFESSFAWCSTTSRRFVHASFIAFNKRRETGLSVTLDGGIVRAGHEGPSVGHEEDRHRPATVAAHQLGRRHVERVDVGTFFAVHLDRDEVLVQERGDGGVLEGLVGHDVTPVTRGVADREEDGTVESCGLVQRRLVPRPPVDGVVGVLAQVGTGRARETIGHWSSVGVAAAASPTITSACGEFRFSVRVEEHRDRDAAGARR